MDKILDTFLSCDNTIKTISDFYNTEVINYAAFDNSRKLCSFIDGLKTSQRKLLYTMVKKYPNEFIKTESFANTCTSFTQYLHGAANLVGVTDNMVQNFVGANNFSLFKGNSGGFGTRINPVCSAGRYTRVALNDISKNLFIDDDGVILDKQFFEGEEIEYKYFVPVFPVLFLNGSEGLSTGFSNSIYPRNPKDIIKYIKKYLNNDKTLPRDCDLIPWFKGYKGEVTFNKELNVYQIFGKIEKINETNYLITEIPINKSYDSYISILDKLCENNTIVDYQDKCDTKTDEIVFEIKTTREFSKTHSDYYDLLNTFKLISNLSETLCFLDEANRPREFSSITEILNAYIDIRYKYYVKRKEYLLSTLKKELLKLISKYLFCKLIIDKELIVSNRKKELIVKDLEKFDKIIKIDNSYDYLLRMPIYQITKEEIEKLKIQISSKKDELKKIKEISEKEMWEADLDKLSVVFKKEL